MAAGEVDHPSVNKGIDYLLAEPGRGRVLGGALLHRDRLPARVLPSLSRLREILSALGACPLPQSESCQHHFSSGWNVSEAPRATGFVIAATGLRAEARIVRRVLAASRAIAGGGDFRSELEDQLWQRDRRRRRGHHQLRHCRRSWPPISTAGTCLVGREVVHGGIVATPPIRAWTVAIEDDDRQGGDGVRIAGVDRPLAWPSAKSAHFMPRAVPPRGRYGKPYRRRGLQPSMRLPFAVLRVIADPVERAATAGGACRYADDGAIDVRAVLASLARNPGQLPALIRLAVDTGRARCASLLRCHDLLGPRLGFRDLGLASAATCARTRIRAGRWPIERDVGRHRSFGLDPGEATFAAFHGPAHRIHDGGSLEAAMHHAIGAFLVIAGAVFVPRRCPPSAP